MHKNHKESEAATADLYRQIEPTPIGKTKNWVVYGA
jgi:ribosomal protein S17